MANKILKKTELASFLGSLEGQVFAPAQSGQGVDFAPYGGGEVSLDYSNTHTSPKSFFFPQSEKLFEFTTKKDDPEAFILKEAGPKAETRALFGIRPCDAKAFAVLDMIFANDQYKDDYWFDKREATTLIGLACKSPCATCFCTSVGASPAGEAGLDALAFDLGETLMIKPLTKKGEAAVKNLPDAAGADEAAASAQAEAASQAITNKLELDNIASRDVMELFDADHWAEVQERCLNCGTCTYLCPTCHCFDIQDETAGESGDRVRNWDSCMSWLFTYHGSGHNPRPDKLSRVRQRFMHKFKYIPIKRAGEIGCVGCGRCITACPVNIDVREVVSNMNA